MFQKGCSIFFERKKFISENLGFFGILGYPRKSRDIFENPGMGIPGFELEIPWDFNIPGLGFFFVGWDIPAICHLWGRAIFFKLLIFYIFLVGLLMISVWRIRIRG